jgi:Uma2 family endonuclease
MTTTEFLLWPDDPTGRRWQLVDGEPRAMAPASDAHGSIQAAFGALIFVHLRDRRSPCRVVSAPGIVPHVRADLNVRIPDLAVTCVPANPNERLLRDPVLIVEILSPSNEAETWANVWAYTTIPSVAEILIMQSLAIGAELLRRQPDGSWPSVPDRLGADADLRLASIDATFRLAEFYATTALVNG